MPFCSFQPACRSKPWNVNSSDLILLMFWKINRTLITEEIPYLIKDLRKKKDHEDCLEKWGKKTLSKTLRDLFHHISYVQTMT